MATRAATFKTGGIEYDEIGIFEAARDVIAQRSAVETGTVTRTMEEWALKVFSPKSGELDFTRNFRFQAPLPREDSLPGPYSEEVSDAEEVVTKKSAQVGASEWSWRWGGRRAEQFGDTVLYIFPTEDHVKDFGDTRIEPAIEGTPWLRRRIAAKFVKNKGLKRIGLGWLYLRGSNSKAGAQSIDADAIVFDEYDLLDAKNLPQIERRLVGARQLGRTPRIRRLGYPIKPGGGIDAEFAKSDQRTWRVTCAECGHEQPVDFWKNVRWRCVEGGPVCRAGHDEYEDADDVAEAWRECVSCSESIEREIGKGRWVAVNPGRRIIGFHITRLIVPTTDLAQIVRASRKSAPAEIETFHVNDLGLAYSPADSALDEKTILAACSHGEEIVFSHPAGGMPATMGLDVAGERDMNATIHRQNPNGTRTALWTGMVKDWEQAEQLMRDFNVVMCAVDSNPERRGARGLAAKFPGRVVLVEYEHRYRAPAIKLKPEDNMVRVNRTLAMDAMMDSIRQLRCLPLREPPKGYVDALMAPKRRSELDANEEIVRKYESTGAPDDYCHAELYGMVATELWRLRINFERQQQAANEEPLMTDEQMGIKRPGLDSDTDVYDPGFSGR